MPEEKSEFYKHVIKWGSIVIISSVLLVLLGPSLVKLLDRTEELKVTVPGGGELVVKAVKDLAAAESKKIGRELSDPEAKAIAEQLQKVDVADLSQKTVLWIDDDNPTNNIDEIRAFNRLGINVIAVQSGD
jgi:hypothetical protein